MSTKATALKILLGNADRMIRYMDYLGSAIEEEHGQHSNKVACHENNSLKLKQVLEYLEDIPFDIQEKTKSLK